MLLSNLPLRSIARMTVVSIAVTIRGSYASSESAVLARRDLNSRVLDSNTLSSSPKSRWINAVASPTTSRLERYVASAEDQGWRELLSPGSEAPTALVLDGELRVIRAGIPITTAACNEALEGMKGCAG